MDKLILGIDLGTTYSTMAVLNHWQSTIVPNADGHPTTPSVVHFYEPGPVVGEEAEEVVATPKLNPIRQAADGRGHHHGVHGEEYTPQAISALILKKRRRMRRRRWTRHRRRGDHRPRVPTALARCDR